MTHRLTNASELRPVVLAFALAMEERLRANDHKGGWDECELEYLVFRLDEELLELVVAAKTTGARFDAAAVQREAADVGNFALMIADLFGGLGPMNAARRRADGEARVP